MRLIGQEVDALAEHQLNEFAGERLLTGLSLKFHGRSEADKRGSEKQSLQPTRRKPSPSHGLFMSFFPSR